MGLITITATVASTRSLEKYPGYEAPVGVLEQMAVELRRGAVPFVFDHDGTRPIEARIVDAQVVDRGTGETAVDVVFEIEEEAWQEVQSEFDAAGVLGGMSYRMTAVQIPPASGQAPLVTLAVDAGAWTDEDRAAAGAMLDAVAPTSTELLFEFSAHEVVSIILVVAHDVGLGVLGNAVYGAIKGLMIRRGRRRTRIQIHQTTADDEFVAVIDTDDPEVARFAIRELAQRSPTSNARFEAATQKWLDV